MLMNIKSQVNRDKLTLDSSYTVCYYYGMKYSIKDLQTDFPDEETCLEWLIEYRFPEGIFCNSIECQEVTKHYRVKSRKSFSCSQCGHHVHPTAGTIFEKSSTPLTLWFYAIFLMANTRSGISAKQLERELGVTYKTAWRMFHQIRKMMKEDNDKFIGIVEADETYIGGRKKQSYKYNNKTAVIGIAEKKGQVKVRALENKDFNKPKVTAAQAIPFLTDNVELLSVLHTDNSHLYLTANKTFKHRTVDHGVTFVKNGVHTNNLEGFWSHLKRGLKGVYIHVEAKYLQAYVDEYVFRYNHRNDYQPMFWSLMAKV